MDLKPIVHKAIAGIRFEYGELAFLAATSKIEAQIRDRLSWRLQCLLPGLYVVREWKRTDIAILNGAAPIALIELKAMYTWDATLDNHQQYIEALRSDEQKALRLATPETAIYTILLASNPKPVAPPPLHEFVKYRSGIEKALRHSTAEDVAASTINIVKKDFCEEKRRLLLQEVARGDGHWFGLEVDVLVWLFEFANK